MRSTLCILLIIIASSILYGQKISFDTSSSWEKLQAKAKKQNKYLFVDCVTDWCGWCKVMDRETFTDKKIAGFMNSHFVAAKIDMEKDYGVNLAMKYRVTGFPSFLIFSPEGKLVYKTFGFQKPEKFILELENALNPEKQLNLRGVSDVVDLDFPGFYTKAFGGKGKRTFPGTATLDSFFISHSDWTDEISFNIISRFRMPEKVQEYFLNEIEQFRYLYDREIDPVLSKLAGEKLSKAIEDHSESLLKEALLFTGKYMPDGGLEMQGYMKLNYWSSVENWQKFAFEFQNLIESEPFNNPYTINNYSWDIYEKCNDQEVISLACRWMEKAIQADPQYAYLDTYAALLYKSGNYDMAEKYAREAIQKGLENKEDVKSSEELLQRIQMEKK